MLPKAVSLVVLAVVDPSLIDWPPPVTAMVGEANHAADGEREGGRWRSCRSRRS